MRRTRIRRMKGRTKEKEGAVQRSPRRGRGWMAGLPMAHPRPSPRLRMHTRMKGRRKERESSSVCVGDY